MVVIKAYIPGVAGKKPKLRIVREQSETYRQSKKKSNRQEMHQKGTRTRNVVVYSRYMASNWQGIVSGV